MGGLVNKTMRYKSIGGRNWRGRFERAVEVSSRVECRVRDEVVPKESNTSPLELLAPAKLPRSNIGLSGGKSPSRDIEWTRMSPLAI
jgi:hypothetical protein